MVYIGSVKIMKVYVIMLLVDVFGDIFYFEVFQGIVNLSFKVDDDEVVYGIVLSFLDEVIVELVNLVSFLNFDFYYGGDVIGWIKLVNILKLCYYVQICLVGGFVSEINVLLDKVIFSVSEDFEFFYGFDCQMDFVILDFCYFYYQDGYENGGFSWYMFNYMMWQMILEKGLVDLCVCYYFCCQDVFEDNENQFMLECQVVFYLLYWVDGYLWCIVFGDFVDIDNNFGGYWGCNYGDVSGILLDDLKCIVWGLYLGGGVFDNIFDIIDGEDFEDNLFQVFNSGIDGVRG